MKKASIISIGNELLNGQTVDTNTTWLCAKLISVGIPTVSSYTIVDDIEEIAGCIGKASAQADIILITGGLGPTDDDVTRQAVAKFLNTKLVLDGDVLEKIQNFFKTRRYNMPEKNKIQAYIPEKTSPIQNDLGTAAGILYKEEKKLIAAMPGVPAEMKKMMLNTVLPEIEKNSSGQCVVIKKLKCFGAGESKIAEMLGDLMDRNRNPIINCTVDYGIITLHVVATGSSRAEAERMAVNDIDKLKNMLGDLVFGQDNQGLPEVVAEMLTRKGLTLALAESCTGGMIAEWLTDIPGASKYFGYGWVTYSNQAKQSQLGVKEEIIEKYGAVSAETAFEMAKNARKIANSDLGVAVTGIAGPAGGSEQKPVGLVYIAIASKNGTETKKFIFARNDRHFIRTRTAQTALNLLRLNLGV